MAPPRDAPFMDGPESAGSGRAARIGPNAVTRIGEALRATGHERWIVPIYAAAGACDWLDSPPQEMVDERQAARLHLAVRRFLPASGASQVLAEAGRLTADYLLAVRIPPAARLLLKALPAPIGIRLLLRAVRMHAWTFAGSGRFDCAAGPPVTIEIGANPLCAGERAAEPVCDWHAAVFQRLFQSLVTRRSAVREVECVASGQDRCRFTVSYTPR